MVQPTVNELSKRIDKYALWTLRHGESVIKLNVYIRDAKNAYGSTRYLCVIEQQELWLDETSLEWEDN